MALVQLLPQCLREAHTVWLPSEAFPCVRGGCGRSQPLLVFLHHNWPHTCHLGSLPSQDVCRLLLISLPRASGIQPHWSLCKVLASVQLGACIAVCIFTSMVFVSPEGSLVSAGSRLSFVKVLPLPSESVTVFYLF